MGNLVPSQLKDARRRRALFIARQTAAEQKAHKEDLQARSPHRADEEQSDNTFGY
jgi:hypothetical protein